jgi:hypothetical protein
MINTIDHTVPVSVLHKELKHILSLRAAAMIAVLLTRIFLCFLLNDGENYNQLLIRGLFF